MLSGCLICRLPIRTIEGDNLVVSALEKNKKHKLKMQRQKERIDSQIAKNNLERGIILLLTGDGKGKTAPHLVWYYVPLAMAKTWVLFNL